MTPLRRRMIDDMTLRNFTPQTIQAYVRCVARFALYFLTSPDQLGPEQLRDYLLHLVQEQHISFSYYKLTRCALRFFYRVTLGRGDVPESLVPVRQPRVLPVVLSLDEVARFFAAISDLKYRAILMTAYAGGLRVSEVTRLRVTDIDGQRMVIRVHQGKGQKDRYASCFPRGCWRSSAPIGRLLGLATFSSPAPSPTSPLQLGVYGKPATVLAKPPA